MRSATPGPKRGFFSSTKRPYTCQISWAWMMRTASRQVSRPSGRNRDALRLGQRGGHRRRAHRCSSAATGASASAKASSAMSSLRDRAPQSMCRRAARRRRCGTRPRVAANQPMVSNDGDMSIAPLVSIAAVRGADAVEPAERGRDAHRAAGVGAEREIAGAGGGRRRRSARRAAGNAARRARGWPACRNARSCRRRCRRIRRRSSCR